MKRGSKNNYRKGNDRPGYASERGGSVGRNNRPLNDEGDEFEDDYMDDEEYQTRRGRQPATKSETIKRTVYAPRESKGESSAAKRPVRKLSRTRMDEDDDELELDTIIESSHVDFDVKKLIEESIEKNRRKSLGLEPVEREPLKEPEGITYEEKETIEQPREQPREQPKAEKSSGKREHSKEKNDFVDDYDDTPYEEPKKQVHSSRTKPASSGKRRKKNDTKKKGRRLEVQKDIDILEKSFLQEQSLDEEIHKGKPSTPIKEQPREEKGKKTEHRTVKKEISQSSEKEIVRAGEAEVETTVETIEQPSHPESSRIPVSEEGPRTSKKASARDFSSDTPRRTRTQAAKATKDEKHKASRKTRAKETPKKETGSVKHSRYYQKKVRQTGPNHKQVVFILSTIAALLIVVWLVIFINKQLEEKPQDTKEQETTLAGGELQKNVSDEVVNLVDAYYKAKTDGDEAAFKEVVDNANQEDLDRIAQEKKYIDKYENISIETKEGYNGGDMVAYVYYEVKFSGIKTPAPGSSVLYIEQNNDSGVYTIHTYGDDKQLTEYINELNSQNDVQKFFAQVEKKYVEACDKDADLKKFSQSLSNAE